MGALAVGGEPYQRGFHIVKQTGPRAGGHTAAGDEHIVAAGRAVVGQQQAHGPLRAGVGTLRWLLPPDLL